MRRQEKLKDKYVKGRLAETVQEFEGVLKRAGGPWFAGSEVRCGWQRAPPPPSLPFP